MSRLAAPLALLLAGCAGAPTFAANLGNAVHPPRLPEVYACWEKEFEAAGFQGEYLAVLDVTLDGAGKLHDARVKSLKVTSGGLGRDPAAFKACLEETLSRASLPIEDDKDGAGVHLGGVRLVDLEVAFTDSAQRKRTAAAGQPAHLLVGPRADRCKGMYSYAPPRKVGTIADELAVLESRLPDYAGNPDRVARELQKKYDANLERIERIEADLADRDVPEKEKARLRKLLAESAETAKKVGAKIGCKR